MLKIIKIRHAWPEPENFSLNRPVGAHEYVFVHFWDPVILKFKGEILTTEPHACIFFKPGTPHSFSSSAELMQDWFHLVGDVEENLARFNLMPDTLYYSQNHEFITSYVRKMEVEFFARKPNWELADELLLCQFFLQLSREVVDRKSAININQNTRDQLKFLRTEISRNYGQKWDIQSMANLINLSPSYLYATYKRLYGVSPIQDLISIRIHVAKTMLTGSEYTISEIAEDLGYSNVTHFTHQFTQVEGFSPSKYRKNNQLNNRLG